MHPPGASHLITTPYLFAGTKVTRIFGIYRYNNDPNLAYEVYSSKSTLSVRNGEKQDKRSES